MKDERHYGGGIYVADAVDLPETPSARDIAEAGAATAALYTPSAAVTYYVESNVSAGDWTADGTPRVVWTYDDLTKEVRCWEVAASVGIDVTVSPVRAVGGAS